MWAHGETEKVSDILREMKIPGPENTGTPITRGEKKIIGAGGGGIGAMGEGEETH